MSGSILVGDEEKHVHLHLIEHLRSKNTEKNRTGFI